MMILSPGYPCRRRKRAGLAPTISQSRVDCLDTHLKLPSPFRKSLRLSVICKDSTISFVIRLLDQRCPSTVLRRVGAGYVNPVDLRLRVRGSAHISKEILERVKPALANGNSDGAIARIVIASLVIASLFHSLPARVALMIHHAVFKIADFRASAANDGSAPKIPGADNLRISTFAFTKPIHTFEFVLGAVKRGKAIEFLSSQIQKFRHMALANNCMD